MFIVNNWVLTLFVCKIKLIDNKLKDLDQLD